MSTAGQQGQGQGEEAGGAGHGCRCEGSVWGAGCDGLKQVSRRQWIEKRGFSPPPTAVGQLCAPCGAPSDWSTPVQIQAAPSLCLAIVPLFCLLSHGFLTTALMQAHKRPVASWCSVTAADRRPAAPLLPQTPPQSRLGRPGRGVRSGAQRHGHQTGGEHGSPCAPAGPRVSASGQQSALEECADCGSGRMVVDEQ